MSIEEFDVLVIGAGMAGASAAAEIAKSCKVAVIERESMPSYHSTGRSAALFSETYGNGIVRALSRASGDFLRAPPEDFAAHPLLRKRGALHIARRDQVGELDAFFAQPDVVSVARKIGASETLALCPLLRQDYAAVSVFEPGAADIDVDALHQGYLRRLRAHNGCLVTEAEVLRIERSAGKWNLRTNRGDFSATVVVNAAGAWVDEVARYAGLGPLKIVPYRRTAVLVDLPVTVAFDNLPMTIDIEETFYFKPDAGKLLLSPGDETPTVPCDAQPEELDVAIAIDRVQTAASIDVTRIQRKWAGLRSFAPDRSPVIGYDPRTEGFFWLAGQGGYGIQTAPAAGLLAAALVEHGEVPEKLVAFGIDEDALSPRRLAPR